MKTKGWMGTVALAALLGATGCSKNEGGNGGGGSNASKLEEYAMTPEWINYATAVSSELLDDCVGRTRLPAVLISGTKFSGQEKTSVPDPLSTREIP